MSFHPHHVVLGVRLEGGGDGGQRLVARGSELVAADLEHDRIGHRVTHRRRLRMRRGGLGGDEQHERENDVLDHAGLIGGSLASFSAIVAGAALERRLLPEPDMTPSLRRSERIADALPVRWIRRPAVLELSTADINLHGMFIRTRHAPQHGSLMQLEVQLPTGPVSMFVSVRFVGETVSGHGIGVEIFLIEAADRTAWSDHYRALSGERALPAPRQAAVALASND